MVFHTSGKISILYSLAICKTSHHFFLICTLLSCRCMLHNFAGNIEMYGILDSIASGPIEARLSKNSMMVSCKFFVAQLCSNFLGLFPS